MKKLLLLALLLFPTQVFAQASTVTCNPALTETAVLSSFADNVPGGITPRNLRDYVCSNAAGTIPFTGAVSTASIITGPISASALTVTGVISSGTLTTGATSLSALTVTGATSLGTITGPDSGTWTGTGINGSVVGASLPKAGTFTTITGSSFASTGFSVDTLGNIQTNQSISGTGVAPTCSATGTGAQGTCVVSAGSNDLSGSFNLNVSGSGITSAGTFTISLNAAVGTHNANCVWQPTNGTSNWTPPVSFIITNTATNVQQTSWTNGANLTSGAVYAVRYVCIGY